MLYAANLSIGVVKKSKKMTAQKIGLSDDDLYLGVPISIEETVAEDYVFVHTNQARKA